MSEIDIIKSPIENGSRPLKQLQSLKFTTAHFSLKRIIINAAYELRLIRFKRQSVSKNIPLIVFGSIERIKCITEKKFLKGSF